MRILILGSSGLIGNTITKYFLNKSDYETFGFLRNSKKISIFKNKYHNNFIFKEDIRDFRKVEKTLKRYKPDLIINCIGITNKFTKTNTKFIDELIYINALFPHKLHEICSNIDARLIHLSTDCVFSGKKGFYNENDIPDPLDIYGRSKLIGELNYTNSLTIRKSAIGHELFTRNGLLEWFLNKNETIEGYKNVIFSGLTVLELAKIIDEYIIPNKKLNGIIHLAGNPISKYELLYLISQEYKKKINIIPNESLKIDRSLNSKLFNDITGYKIKDWRELISSMHKFFLFDK